MYSLETLLPQQIKIRSAEERSWIFKQTSAVSRVSLAIVPASDQHILFGVGNFIIILHFAKLGLWPGFLDKWSRTEWFFWKYFMSIYGADAYHNGCDAFYCKFAG